MYPRLHITQFAPLSPFPDVWLCRHGQCFPNLWENQAKKKGEDRVKRRTGRIRDLALTGLGQRQSYSLGAYLSEMETPPTLIVSSPLRRALDSAKLVAIPLLNAGKEVEIVVCPDIYDRQGGEIDLLRFTSTTAYLRAADDSERKRWADLGELYYAAPAGGEHYAHCCGRARNAWRDIKEVYGDKYKGVLIMCHNSMVRAFTAACCGMTEEAFVAFCKKDVPNGSVFALRRNDEGFLSPVAEDFVKPPLVRKRDWKTLMKQEERRAKGGSPVKIAA